MSGITQIIKAEGWKEHPSTALRRVIFLAGETPVGVAPVGTFQVPLIFKRYDRLMFITVGPHREAIHLRQALLTKDGIPLGGEIPVEFRVSDSEAALLQFALNPSSQLASFTDRILASAQRLIAGYTYIEFDALRVASATELVADFTANNATGSCALDLIAAHLNALDTTDQQLKEARIKLMQAQEAELLRTKQAHWATERAANEAKLKLIEAESRLKLEQLQEEQKIELDTKRREQELILQGKRAELLRTEEGRMSQDMSAVLDHKAKELEVQKLVAQLGDKQARDVLKAVLSHQSGANSVLRTIAANQIGIKLSDDSALADSIAKLTENSDEISDTPPSA